MHGSELPVSNTEEQEAGIKFKMGLANNLRFEDVIGFQSSKRTRTSRLLAYDIDFRNQ